MNAAWKWLSKATASSTSSAGAEAAEVLNRYYADETDNCAIYSGASFTANKRRVSAHPFSQLSASNGHYKQNIGNW